MREEGCYPHDLWTILIYSPWSPLGNRNCEMSVDELRENLMHECVQ